MGAGHGTACLWYQYLTGKGRQSPPGLHRHCLEKNKKWSGEKERIMLAPVLRYLSFTVFLCRPLCLEKYLFTIMSTSVSQTRESLREYWRLNQEADRLEQKKSQWRAKDMTQWVKVLVTKLWVPSLGSMGWNYRIDSCKWSSDLHMHTHTHTCAHKHITIQAKSSYF